jgi:hypothetical protein
MVFQLVAISVSGSWTSITLKQGTKAELDTHREEGESWDAFVSRWLNDKPPKKDESIARLDEKMDNLPESVAGAVIDELETRR